MEHIIDQYIKEDFRYYKGNFSFSCMTLTIEVVAGDVCSGTFEFISDTVVPEEILVQTTHDWVKLEVEASYESKVRFRYTVEVDFFHSNIVTTGEILVLTNMGEYSLTYVIQKQRERIVVHDTVITTLLQFAEFAKKNWKEAVSIFYSKAGELFFQELGSEVEIAYGLFSSIYGHAGNVDEFLIYLKAKDEMLYFVVEKPAILTLQNAAMRQVVTILKEGYGEVHVHVSASDNFIMVAQNYLTEEHFISNECSLQYTFNLAKLKKGLNQGIISLETDYHTIEIPVSVQVPLDQVIAEYSKSVKSQIVAIMKLYIAYRMRKIERKEWFDSSIEIIEELLDEKPQDLLTQLCQVQLLVVNGRKNEATWLLNALKDRIGSGQISEEFYSYYMYLSTLTESDEEYILSATAKISILYEQHSTFWVAWILCYMKEEYQRDLAGKLEFLKRHGYEGCNSPLLYLEILQIYNNNPGLLERLDQFALETIYFGMKYKWIEQRLFDRVQELAIEIMEYSKITIAILIYCYDKEYNVEVLHTICRILIRENLVGEEHYKWYMLAVEQQVRVTNIYEHYMSSMPIDNWDQIAKPALLYFAYSNHLPYEQKTLLYLYVLEHQEELLEIMDVYEVQMKEFVVEQIQLGRISDKLAMLYELVVTTEMLTTQLAESLVKIIFQEEIVVLDSNIKNVIVVHENILEESIYPVIRGQALITIYHLNAKIMLEDQYQNRTIATHTMKRDRLLNPKEWYQMILTYAVVSPYLDWYLANEVTDCSKITIKNVLSIARLIGSEQISMKWKGIVRKYLATFYYEHDMIEELDQMIGQLKREQTDYAERKVFLQYMIKRGFYDQAYGILQDYGCEAHEVKLLVRLCKRILGAKEIEYDAVILEVAFYAYRNQEYDRTLLGYLVQYYAGDFHTMKQLYFTCMQHGIDVTKLAKRIILRILFCKWNEEDHDIIYNDYLKSGAEQAFEVAYLKYEALLYLGDEKAVITTVVEDWLRYYRLTRNGRIIPLGIIKYFATKIDMLKEVEQQLVVELVKPLIEEKIYFPFFKGFAHLYEPISNFSDDTMVVYQSTISNKVSIYYNEIEEVDTNKPYKKIELNPMFGQFYVQNFLLFLGEGIQYYIVEEQYGVEVITKRDTVTISNPQEVEVIGDVRSRYHMLNKMQLHFSKKETELFEKEVDDYLKRGYLSKKLFDIL
ncbi:MAG: DUF5717 family protein [Eubacteriales bacterium]